MRVPEECPSVSSPWSLYFLASVVLGMPKLWRVEEAIKSAPAGPWANDVWPGVVEQPEGTGKSIDGTGVGSSSH